MAGDWIIDAPYRVISDAPPHKGAPGHADLGKMRMTDFVATLQDIRTTTQDGGVFWNIGAHYDLASLGPAGQAIAAAPTLGKSLDMLQRAFPLIQTGALMSLETHGSDLAVHYRVLDPKIWPRQADTELTMGLIFGIVRRFVPDAAAVMDLGFEHAPDAAGNRLQRGLGCPVTSGEASNTLCLPVATLACGPVSEQAGAGASLETLERSVARLMQGLRADQSVTDQCRTEVLSRLGRGSLDQAEVGRALGLPDRSLRLHLREEGTSYRQIVDTCRAETAALLLDRTVLPLAEIAWRLGYSEHSAFTRAAKRWFGKPPEARRATA